MAVPQSESPQPAPDEGYHWWVPTLPVAHAVAGVAHAYRMDTPPKQGDFATPHCRISTFISMDATEENSRCPTCLQRLDMPLP
ncbi:hypothetical protein GCM10010174_61260 [Kutzneria viridogrisea]|uniref:Uncharacterized protein n=1 Tax=Kutzneria viridogrisea TaxID=47990 RepID=A0ABR6BHA4_9PSEU|nr:hypothetical protein [Kutzneria viridogrisea]